MFFLNNSNFSNFKYSKYCSFISRSIKGNSVRRNDKLVSLNALQNREDIQKMFGTVGMDKPYIIPLVNIASQLYSGLSTICEAVLLVRDRSLFEFRKIFDIGSINPTFCITYNSLVIFIQGCYNQIMAAESLKERLTVAGVKIDLIVISTYSFAAFWTLQHILSFSLTKATISLIQNIGGDNIPLIRIHEIYYKMVFGVFNGGTLKLNGEYEMCNLHYRVRPSMTFELWHNGYKDVDAIVREVLNLIESIDDDLNREEAYCIVKSLIDGEKTDYAGSGLTGSLLQKLQNYLAILNNLNRAGSIAKVLVSGIINEKNCEPIARIMEGFYTVICAANIPFKLAKDIQNEQLTLMEFTYAFPIVSSRTDCHPSQMEIYIGTLIDVNLSKFIAYGWASIIGSTVSLNGEILLENPDFGEGVLNNLLMIESEFNKPYGDLLRHSFIMLTGVITDKLGTSVDGLPKGLNDFNPNCNVRYIGDTTTGNFGQIVERSILSDGIERDGIVLDTDLFNIDKYLSNVDREIDSDKSDSENKININTKEDINENTNTSNIDKSKTGNSSNINSDEIIKGITDKSVVSKGEEERLDDQLFLDTGSKVADEEEDSNGNFMSKKSKRKAKGGSEDSSVKRDSNGAREFRQIKPHSVGTFTGSSFDIIAMKNSRGLNKHIAISGVNKDISKRLYMNNRSINTTGLRSLELDSKDRKSKGNFRVQIPNLKFKLNFKDIILTRISRYSRSPPYNKLIVKKINIHYRREELNFRRIMRKCRVARSPTLNLIGIRVNNKYRHKRYECQHKNL